MYQLNLGMELVTFASTTKDAFEMAVSAYRQGWEVTVVSTVTGEILMMLRDDISQNYVSNAVVYGI